MQISPSVARATEKTSVYSTTDYSLTVPRAILILAAVYGMVSFLNLNGQSVSNPDEPRLAFAAREMLRGKDWLVPQFNTQQHLTKPIFFYWVIAIAGYVGQFLGLGLSAAFRLGPVFMGFFTVLAVFFIGLRFRNVRYAFFSAAILATSFTFHRISRLLVVDMTLSAFLLWAWYWFILSLDRIDNNRSALKTLLAFYITLGFACMTKGPGVVAVFVVVPAGLLLWWEGRLKLLARAGLWWGVPLALLLGHWWFIALAWRGLDMKRNFLVENFGRISGLDHLRPVPFVFYIDAIIGAFAPWTLFLPFAIVAAVKEFRARASAPLGRDYKILCCCLIFPFTAIGLAVTKRPLYALPLYPFLSLLLARYFELTLFTRTAPLLMRRWVKALPFVLPVLFGIGLAVALQHYRVPSDMALSPASILAVVIVLTAAHFSPRAAIRQDWLRMLNYCVVLAAGLLLSYEAAIAPTFERQHDTEAFYAKVGGRLNGRKLVLYGDNTNEAVWYLDRPTIEVESVKFNPSLPDSLKLTDTAILCTADILSRTPALKEALVPEMHLARDNEDWVLGSAAELKHAIIVHNFATIPATKDD